uniref:SorC n=1 Tax=Sorangium cellulosum TaxID=56 RepID=E5FNE6_SORCE|nr:SorC [Sorangium cellulosum]
MNNLVGYLLKEMKDGRLSKADVLELLAEQGTSTRGADELHPLAQRNTSSFDEQRFSSTLRADSFFLSDHVVQGQMVLPAVCYLEMARAAVRASVEPGGEPHAGLGLRDVTWLKPLIVTDARDVHIGLYAQENGDVEFEVYTDVVHAHGRAQWTRPSIAEEPRAVDVADLRARCDRSFESATAYSAFRAMGLEYGAAHRGLTSLHAGADADGRPFVVAHVEMPPSAGRGSDRYVLHPSVLDCAMQASIGLALGDGPIEPALPFALEAVEILDRTPSSAWVVVRPREAGSLERLDIAVCDDAGRVCVQLKGLATRAVPNASRSDSAGRIMTLSPRREARPAASTAPWPPADVPAEAKEAGASPMPQSGAAGPGAQRAERLRALAIAALKRLVSRTLGAQPHELVETEPLLKYGLESILVVSLSNELKRFFPQLSSTAFFQRQTIGALATYLLEMDPAAVSRWVGLEERPAPAPPIDDVPADRRDGGEATEAKGASLLPRAKRGLRRRALTASPTTEPTREAIAIIGMSGRYPQARTVEQLWDNLLAGKSCITEVPNDRWDHRLYFDPEKGRPGKSYSKWGGFLDAIDRFDPLFFRISPAEAERIDPQERLFLQEAYACIEDAGYTPATLCGSRRVGVYVGVMNSTYFRHATYWSIANRVSYVCDFQGPSMAVDTACSSSLTAIHLAIEALHSGSCDVAIAGGVHLIVDPVQLTNLSEMNMLSSDDRCKAFGARADGFVDGEGVGAIVLKPLRRAVADGDHVYGVIRGSLLNAGGKTHGYTVPNPTAQANLIEAALRRANVDPRTISYVEAHGTGTELGDPIEIAGLTQAFASWTGDLQYCAIGSLKSNVGHLESAAGIAAVTKVLLQMQHRTLVPSLHSQELNPHIDFARTPFKVQQHPEEWRRPVVEMDGRQQEYPRIAGISSFGAGGSNAHLIVEEYCAAEPVGTPATERTPERPALIVLSAKSEERLRAYATELRAHLARHAYSDRDLEDIAYTLQVGREAMDHRLAFTATRIQELEDKLQGYLEGRAERGEIDEFYAGQVKRGNEMLALFTGDEELQEAVRKWVDRGKYSKLLELWVNGLSFDWSLLSSSRGRRLSLPTYPFAGERYWSDRSAVAAPPGAPALEPRSSSTGAVAESSGAVRIPSVPAHVEEDDWAVGELMLAPQWEPVTPLGAAPWPEPGDAVVWIGGTPEERLRIEALYPHGRALDVAPADSIPRIVERLSAGGPFTHVFWMAPREESSEPHAVVLSGLRLVKALLRAGYGEKSLGLTVVTRQACGIEDDERIDPDHAAAHGLMGSVAKEYPHWRIRIVDVSDDGLWPAGEVARLPADARGNAWAYRNGQWYGQRWHRYELAEHDIPTRFRHRGVYVVLGGAGRLGETLTEYLIQKYHARVVWIGRRALDEDIQAKLDRLGRLGPAPTYRSADAADAEELAQAYREIKAQHGAIHGLIHATMVMSGSDLAHMDETRFALGLRAKADVSVRMAQVFGEEPLDFVLFYSSIVSFERSPRQSNYAAGSVFNDAFALRLSRQWARPVKIMNWGYCGPLPESLQNWLNEAGFSLIEPERAMVALEELLASPLAQLAFVSTTRPRALKGIELGRERMRRLATTLPSLAQVLSTCEVAAPPTNTRIHSAFGN